MKTILIICLAAFAMLAQPRVTKYKTIAQNDSVTSVLSLDNYTIGAIGVPSTWTTANIYVMAADSSGKGEYQFVRNYDGTLFYVPMTAGQITKIDPSLFVQFTHIKLVSMLSGAYVVQTSSDKNIELYLVNYLKN